MLSARYGTWWWWWWWVEGCFFFNLYIIISNVSYLLVGFQRLPLYSGRHVWNPNVQPDPGSVCESAAGSALPAKLPAGGLKSRRGAPAPSASETPVARCSGDRVCQIKRQLSPLEMAARRGNLAQQLSDDGGHCHHFLRQLPAGTLPCHHLNYAAASADRPSFQSKRHRRDRTVTRVGLCVRAVISFFFMCADCGRAPPCEAAVAVIVQQHRV